MTDGLTDAVRRLKKLQQDVERLKSGEDEEGEPRLLFSIQEQAAADDRPTLRQQRQINDDGHWNSIGYTTASYNDP
jgi:hypothetical protein